MEGEQGENPLLGWYTRGVWNNNTNNNQSLTCALFSDQKKDELLFLAHPPLCSHMRIFSKTTTGENNFVSLSTNSQYKITNLTSYTNTQYNEYQLFLSWDLFHIYIDRHTTRDIHQSYSNHQNYSYRRHIASRRCECIRRHFPDLLCRPSGGRLDPGGFAAAATRQ